MSSWDPHLVENLRSELETLGVWEALEEKATTDVMLNENGTVWVAGLGGVRRLAHTFEAVQLETAIGTLAALHGLEAHRGSPLLEALLPFGGIRAQATLPPVAPAPALTLRKPPARLMPLAELVSRGTLSAELASRLEEAVVSRVNLVLAGGVGSGKTTLAAALLDALVRRHPEERILILEEGARELRCEGQNVVRLLADEASGVTIRRLLRHALRSNPDRILLGEARGAEAYDFLKAANTGHPGSLLTVHANSARDALERLDSLVQEAGVPSQLPQIRRTVGMVVCLRRGRGGERRVEEVWEVGEVAGRVDGEDEGSAGAPAADCREG